MRKAVIMAPRVKRIMEYFDLTPTLFFAPMDDPDSLRGIIGKKLLALPDEDLEKVVVFLDWIRK